MSNVGIEKIVSRSAEDVYDTKKEDSTKDTFSVYINRAKMIEDQKDVEYWKQKDHLLQTRVRRVQTNTKWSLERLLKKY